METVDRLVTQLGTLAREDDEWSLHDRFVPIQVIPPLQEPTGWLIVAKLTWLVQALGEASVPPTTGLIGYQGIPTPATTRTIRSLTAGAASVAFLGDLDPLDLTAYVALRASIPSLLYSGITEAWLSVADRAVVRQTGDAAASIDRRSIGMSAFEQVHWRLLKGSFPDLPPLVGARGDSLLDTGRKLELEALLSARGSDPAVVPETVRALGWVP